MQREPTLFSSFLLHPHPMSPGTGTCKTFGRSVLSRLLCTVPYAFHDSLLFALVPKETGRSLLFGQALIYFIPFYIQAQTSSPVVRLCLIEAKCLMNIHARWGLVPNGIESTLHAVLIGSRHMHSPAPLSRISTLRACHTWYGAASAATQ